MNKKKIAYFIGKFWGNLLLRGDKDKFALSVERRILDILNKETDTLIIECEYDPCDILIDALQDIGIDCRGFFFSAKGILPQKHSTIISHKRDKIEIREGYGNWRIIKIKEIK